MADQDININVNVVGDAEAEAKLVRIGAVGAKSLGQVDTSAATASKSLTEAGTAGAAAAAQLRSGFAQAAQPIAAAETAVGGFLRSIGALGGRIRSTIPQIGALNDASDQAGVTANSSNANFVRLGQTLRLLGRAARVHELSTLGRTLGVVGRAAALAIPAITIAALGKIAFSAAAAAEAFTAFQNKLGLTSTAAGRLQNVGTALGLGIDKTQGSFEALGKLVGEASDKEKENATAAAALKSQYNDAVGALSGFDKETKQLAKSHTELNLKLAGGTITTKEFLDEQTKLKEEQQAHNKAVAEAVQKANDLAIAQVKQRGEAIANQNVLQKLGVSLTDNNGKLIKSDEAFARLAGALAGVTDKEQRLKIEQELVAQGFDSQLLPALRRGQKGFEELVAQGAKIRPPFTDAQIKTLDAFSIASGQVAQAFLAIRDAIGVAVAPAFTAFFERLVQIFEQIRPGLAEFAQTLGSVLGPILQAIGSLIQNVIVPAFQGLVALAQIVADAINKAFGTNISAMQVFVSVLLALGVIFGGAVIAATALAIAIGALVDQLLKIPGVKEFLVVLGQVLKEIATFIVTEFLQAIIDFVKAFVAGINTISNGWTALVAVVKAVWAAIVQTASDAINAVVGFFQPFIDKVKEAWDFVKKLAAAIASLGTASASSQVGAGAAGAVGAAGGGYIRGPGTSTSDSILARLSKGEFVIRAAAVDKYGVRLMHAINHMRLPRGALPGFSMGGMVDALQIRGPIPAYAAGGEVTRKADGTSINLHIDGETFNLLTRDEETATRLTRYATTRRMRSAGKKPGYYSA